MGDRSIPLNPIRRLPLIPLMLHHDHQIPSHQRDLLRRDILVFIRIAGLEIGREVVASAGCAEGGLRGRGSPGNVEVVDASGGRAAFGVVGDLPCSWDG